MDTVNIVSSQAVLDMSSFSTDTRWMSSSPLVNSFIKNRLHKTSISCRFNSSYRFVGGRHDAAWQLRSRNPQDWDLGCLEATGWTKESFTAVQLLHLLEQSRHQTLCLSLAAVWRHYDVVWSSIEEVSKRYHQNFLLFNNNELTACIADLFNSFCEVYAVAFLSASLYVSKRGAYWDRLCRDVVGRWLIVGWLVVGCHARALWPNGAS